ncbi:MAG TPA: phenylalanine--tRNA ligase subunit alpha [Nitrospirae bacterium]|nr:phenylalanine--tRNA ligase subunit alpha [Nitrospirota bacterium]HDZ02856.1 phenylalanine--tRNA ligase subunit alpha [Nitrospirota bacterium]
MLNDIESIKNLARDEISNARCLQDIYDLKVKYLGKKGLLTGKLKSLGSIPREERPAFGRILNESKNFIESLLRKQEDIFKSSELDKSLRTEQIDVTVPGCFIPTGHLHPITQVLDEISGIFISLGFTVEEGPEVELDYYNFEALNFPKDHPARDMQDTFFISDDVVLRTHTSSVQVRVMEKSSPPLRVIAPGKVYRCDADVSHIPMFHQLEGFMVDRHIHFSDLKGVLELFIHRVFGRDTSLRFRPSFFPFTEPSAEIDISCVICNGSGCNVCGGTGWIEILGAGMINPRVYEKAGYDPELYTGFAFGLGIERVAMLKYGIDDIRLFPENDKRFLEQF